MQIKGATKMLGLLALSIVMIGAAPTGDMNDSLDQRIRELSRRIDALDGEKTDVREAAEGKCAMAWSTEEKKKVPLGGWCEPNIFKREAYNTCCEGYYCKISQFYISNVGIPTFDWQCAKGSRFFGLKEA